MSFLSVIDTQVNHDRADNCSDQPSKQAVPDNRKVLMDTQDYTGQSLVKIDGGNGIWISENYDNISSPNSAFEKVSLMYMNGVSVPPAV